jgi:hypothetical protein
MKNRLLLLILIVFMGLSCASCKTSEAEAEDMGYGDASADDLIAQSFTFMKLINGEKSGEKISGNNFQYVQHLDQPALEAWSPENGDLFFFRGNMVVNDFYHDKIVYGDYFAIIPLEPEFYWNGVGLYYDGFLYKITATENGPRIYNQGLWTIGSHCLIVQASSSLALSANSLNADMMGKIHKLPVKRGHLKAALMNPNIDGKFTPPGLADRFYANHGKRIRPDGAGEYVRAEDFIEKTDAANGHFQSATPDLTIKNVYIYSSTAENAPDCSKVY